MIDLNSFKRINDLHGHAVGDEVLEVVAERFRAAARPSDLVARLGDDELAVLAYNVDQDTAHKIGLRFLDALEGEIRVAGHTHKVPGLWRALARALPPPLACFGGEP
jgi:diguanylate cyclase (GGDEF)-like protein